MRKVYCYVEKEEKPGEIDHSGDIVKDLSSLNISDIKNRSFFFIGGKIIENPYYEPSEYMKHVYEAIDAQYEQFYRSDKDKKDAEEETNEQSSDDEMLPDWIAEMPRGELIKKFPGGISEALEYAKKEKGLSVPEVHYNSPEPKKLGVKAFTKNAEVYLAPGEGEETLKHELGHVVQQKKEKIPATTKIGEQQVNLDPKLEQEADEFAEHIEDHIPEIISEKPTDVKTNDVIQFELPEREELWPQIEAEAKNMGISENFINQELVKSAIMNKVEEYYKSFMWWAWWRMTYKNDNYLDTCIIWGLNSIKSENSEECNLYSELENSKLEDNEEEKARITEIMAMLSTEKIFPTDTNSSVTLHTIMSWLTSEQCQKVKKYILKLKTYCDAKGIKSVLEGASVNSVTTSFRLLLQNPDNTSYSDDQIKVLAGYFVKRLELMTSYIEEVADKKDSDERSFKDKYFIRSTGSDPHYKGQHALFLANKYNQEGSETDPRKKAGNIAKVYKPHDLSADTAVVGKKGIFNSINNLFKKEEALKGTIIADEDAFATMNIDVKHHIEEFIIKKESMTQREAEKYFFRAGMLKVITDAMAVIDLHKDNIMPGFNNLPFITDAEVDFFKYADSGLESDALKEDVYEGRFTNSSFKIENEEQRSGGLFKDKESKYYKQFKDGYNIMLRKIKNRKDTFLNYYTSVLNTVDKVRIVPIKTGDLSKYLHGYMISPESDKTGNINWIKSEISKKLRDNQGGYIFAGNNNLKINLDESKFFNAIKTEFDNGTIIAMYVDMNGKIYLGNIENDQEIGQIVYSNGSSVGNDGLKNLMEEKFSNEVDRMTYM